MRVRVTILQELLQFERKASAQLYAVAGLGLLCWLPAWWLWDGSGAAFVILPAVSLRL